MRPDRAFGALLALSLISVGLVAAVAARFLRAGIPGATQPERVTAGHGLFMPGTSDLAIHLIGTALLCLLIAGGARALLVLLARLRQTRIFVRQLLAARAAPEPDVVAVAARVGIAARLDVVASRHSLACCYGLWRPRVLVSSAFLDHLDRAELVAVLRHEAYHLARRDPLRLLIADAVAALCSYLPLAGMLRDHHAVAAELAADRHAAAADMGRGLAAALHKLINLAPRATPATLPGATGALSLRIAALLGEELPSHHHLHRRGIVLSSIGWGLLTWLLVAPTSLFVGHQVALPAPLAFLLHQCIIR